MIKKKEDLKAQTEVQLHLQPSQKLKAQPKPILLPKKTKTKAKDAKDKNRSYYPK